MKKIIIVLILIGVIFMFITKEEYLIIPEESIRFRIIPNSNSTQDIFIKQKLITSLSNEIKNIEKSNNINESRKNIINNMDNLKNIVSKTLKENNYNLSFNINYGSNYFPEKIYDGVLYKSGYYESLVIELGEAKGDNFWCVMFPPLCMLETDDKTKVEYKFFVKEILEKITKL